MQYRAILKCRECAGNRGKSTTNSALFSYDSEFPINIPNAQDAFEEQVTLPCDHCGESDWRVIEVQQVHSRGA